MTDWSCEEMFPILINTKLVWMDLSSRSIVVNDQSLVKLLWALSSATQLLYLSLAGWKFNITVRFQTNSFNWWHFKNCWWFQHRNVWLIFKDFMNGYQLQELNLKHCRLRLNFPLTDCKEWIGSSRQDIFHRRSEADGKQRSKILRWLTWFPSASTNQFLPNLVKLSLEGTVVSYQVTKYSGIC